MVDGQQETSVINGASGDPNADPSLEQNGSAVDPAGQDSDSAQTAVDEPVDATASDTAAGSDLESSEDAEGDARDAAAHDSDGSDDSNDPDDSDDPDDDSDDSADSENPLDIEGEVAADYLEELLDIADLDGDIDTYVENGRAHVSVLTDSDVLVGQEGEVLEALQELARLAVITETGNRSRLMLDIGGFRERRRKALTELATDAVQEAKASGEPVRLSPMNPFERKIVHDVVAEAGLTSESEGEEPQRRVVILPNA